MLSDVPDIPYWHPPFCLAVRAYVSVPSKCASTLSCSRQGSTPRSIMPHGTDTAARTSIGVLWCVFIGRLEAAKLSAQWSRAGFWRQPEKAKALKASAEASARAAVPSIYERYVKQHLRSRSDVLVHCCTVPTGRAWPCGGAESFQHARALGNVEVNAG